MSVRKEETCIDRWRITVKGIVQGVGFRPFVYQLAQKFGIKGWVCNTAEGVLIEAESEERLLKVFVDSIRLNAPVTASVKESFIERLSPVGYTHFEIHNSFSGTSVDTVIPPDIATCEACLDEIFDRSNRRYGYPFTNCTNCGPRFTIVQRIPYDRENTTMQAFKMCEACQAEYDNPMDRRFHAQPNACPNCGPHLTLNGRYLGDAEVIKIAAQLLWQGKILAIKGLGGFHLACDATNDEAVKTLRYRKGRAGKPFAMMCANMKEVHRICEVDQASEALLVSPERPIVLMRARSQTNISSLVAPGVKTFGVMLPYTPLHHLLMAQSPPVLVMTSGNLSEEPIAYQDEEAVARLGRIADDFVGHNRPIYIGCDDSVVRVYEGLPMMLRRARGYVPRPIELPTSLPSILACGADLKNTFCLTKGNLALMSQHLGDLDNVHILVRYREVIAHFCRFFNVQPCVVAHDLHPEYRSARIAESFVDCRLLGVQHHHAHVASCMAENMVEEKVIGVAFDGTGYGLDRCIWGGEFLVADYSGFERFAHLAYVPIPGGEVSIRHPYRMALAYLVETFGSDGHEIGLEIMKSVNRQEASMVQMQIQRRLNCSLTSSMGRLFDAVSALLNVCLEVTYEGQAAVELEGIAEGPVEESYPYELMGSRNNVLIDVRPMIRAIVDDIYRNTNPGIISSRFHSTIADIIVTVCKIIRSERGINRVALSGGVFQNALLFQLAFERLAVNGFEVLRHNQVPCNDGGIALGQAVIAAARLKANR
jgi:hydrogenase maturation protein HypF